MHVITGFPHYPEWKLKEGYSGWVRSEVINGVTVDRVRHFVPSGSSALARIHMELSFGLRLLCANWRAPDVVLLVSPALFSSAIALFRARLRVKRPAIGIWVQDLYSRGVVETGTGGGRAAAVIAVVESLILRSTDGVVAIHDRFKQHMVDALRVSAGNVRVIRNWTHLPTSPCEGRCEVRAHLGWTPEDIVVLHAGNMGKKQGLENVIAAAQLAQDRRSAVRFVLLGDGNQKKKLQTMSAGLERLQFIDPLPGPDFMAALAAADILLVNELPGIKDMAVPSKLTSYFNAGIAVIAATDAGSVTAKEIATSMGGIRVDAADPEGLLAAAERLGADDEYTKTLGLNGLRFRHDTLSESAAVDRYDDFVTSLASSRGR